MDMSGGATRTTCPYCGVGCGLLARPLADGTVEIKGDPDHPANFGRLCSKGAALGQTLSQDDRLLHPVVNGARASWDVALDLVAGRFAETIAEHGPESVAFYLSGQILTEDYYVANKLMKGFIGGANIDTNSRLCMASSVAGHKRAFGTDTVPGTYEDLEQADLVVLVGSNLAWCHPVLYQRLAAARVARGTKVVVIDPRETATCEIADLHLAIAPGGDVALFNGLLAFIAQSSRVDRDYVARHTSNFAATLDVALAMNLAEIAAATELPISLVADFYGMFAETERVVTVYSQGVNQSSAGTDKVNAIINCHLATGRIGRVGMGPFSVTGQPNAMGGREVGGLANMLAAHMEIDNPEHRRIVRGFWQSPTIAEKPGLKAVELFRAVETGHIKALWIMATNPVVSMPEADRVRAAIQACPFVVVSDVTAHTDTAALGHVLLPSAGWGEKSGTVTNSERRISRQRSFLDAAGEARPDWWQMKELAKRMGFGDAFDYAHPAEIFAEYAQLTGAENAGRRDLDISGAALSRAAYDTLTPFQWPHVQGSAQRETRFFANGNFFTPDRRARFVPTPFRPLAQATSAEYPLVLNTGRIRDQWHTMTRTSKAPRLMAHAPEPFVEIHPADADAWGLNDGHLAEIASASGKAVGRIVVTDSQRRGTVFVPMHWTDQLASRGRVDVLIAANVDPVSGQPELKGAPATVRPFAAAWFAFAVMRQPPDLHGFDYFATAAISCGHRVELAGCTDPSSWDDVANNLLLAGVRSEDAETLAYHDPAAGQFRYAAFAGNQLAGALFVARKPVTVARTWIAEQLTVEVPAPARLRLLAGRPGGEVKDRGRVICACFEVGLNEIVDAIVAQGASDVAAVGARVKAGTNCGSCRTEIGRILDEARISKAG